MRYAVYFIGVALLVAAAFIGGEMLTSEAPFEPVLPCTLAVLGAGIFGFGLFASFDPEHANACEPGNNGEIGGAPEVDGE
jgi:hypothetical protein